VHVRQTESLKAYCILHLELSGSRAKSTAAHPGAPPWTSWDLAMTVGWWSLRE